MVLLTIKSSRSKTQLPGPNGSKLESTLKPRAQGSDRICLPGEPEWEAYAAAEEAGLELPDDVFENTRALGNWIGLDITSCLI